MPNPSFECGQDQCDHTIWANQFYKNVCDWYCPNESTTDAFSTLLINKACFSSMPLTIDGTPQHNGSQAPRTGNRFIGMYTYGHNGASDYREYVQGKLIAPLDSGEIYCAELYASVAERYKYATNNLGFYFHSEPIIDYIDNWYLDLDAQVVDTTLIMDSINWVRVYGAFRASSPHQYVTVGNFMNNTETRTVNRPGRGTNASQAYYYVDDVSVSKLIEKKFSLTGPGTICSGEVVDMTAGGSLEDIVWTTIDDTLSILGHGSSLSVTPMETTTYLVKGHNCRIPVYDTITINVKESPSFSLGSDTTICNGTSYYLDPGPFATYQWNGNWRERIYEVTQSSNYFVRVTAENGCVGFDQVSITVEDKPAVELGSDQLVCDEYFELDAGDKDYEWLWSDGSTESTAVPTSSGKYWVTAKNQCGEDSDTVTIYSMADLFVPNVVILHGLPENRKFQITGIGDMARGDLSIYNRWGERVYYEKNYEGGWPPDSDDTPAGIYYYTLYYPGCRTYKGWIQLFK